MESVKKVAVVTGTRAEYGLLRPLILKLQQIFKTQIIATGMHLSPEFGLTIKEIENDGIKVVESVEILLSSDTNVGVVKSMGLAMISFADVFKRLSPDLLLVLGDRFEVLSVVSAANVMNIPVAHLHGGELTEGAIDDSMRHAITKMSHLHFTSTEEYRRRVIQLGEDPNRVFNTGAIGIDNIVDKALLSNQELEQELQVEFDDRTVLVTYHPVTIEDYLIEKQISNLLTCLDELENTTIVFTKANSDVSGRYINQRLAEWVEPKEKAYLFDSLGSLRYLSLLRVADLVVGNSSSGIIEAPTFKTPTVNIGERQSGRIRAESVIDCTYATESIKNAIHTGLSEEFNKSLQNMKNPYGEGNTSEKIMTALQRVDFAALIRKKFYDWK